MEVEKPIDFGENDKESKARILGEVGDLLASVFYSRILGEEVWAPKVADNIRNYLDLSDIQQAKDKIGEYISSHKLEKESSESIADVIANEIVNYPYKNIEDEKIVIEELEVSDSSSFSDSINTLIVEYTDGKKERIYIGDRCDQAYYKNTISQANYIVTLYEDRSGSYYKTRDLFSDPEGGYYRSVYLKPEIIAELRQSKDKIKRFIYKMLQSVQSL